MSLNEFINGPATRFWHDWQAALIALAVALAVRFAAERTGKGQLAAQAPVMGAMAGWIALTYSSLHATMTWPLNEHARLLALAALALGTGLSLESLSRAGQGLTLIVTIIATWLLLGAPFDYRDLIAILAQAAILGTLCGVTILWLRNANGWTIALAAVAFWVNLHLAGVPVFWQLIGASCAAGTLTLLGRGSSGQDEIGIAAIIAFAAISIDLSQGKLRQDGFNLADMACCSPMLTGFVAPRLGQNDIVLGSILGAVASTALLWAVKTFA